MTVAPATIKATDVRPGDRVRARSGAELTVTRIDEEFMGRANMLAFVEDSEEQWFKMPALRDGDVELVRRDDGVD
jgi:hypothetical protein